MPRTTVSNDAGHRDRVEGRDEGTVPLWCSGGDKAGEHYGLPSAWFLKILFCINSEPIESDMNTSFWSENREEFDKASFWPSDLPTTDHSGPRSSQPLGFELYSKVGAAAVPRLLPRTAAKVNGESMEKADVACDMERRNSLRLQASASEGSQEGRKQKINKGTFLFFSLSLSLFVFGLILPK